MPDISRGGTLNAPLNHALECIFQS